MLRLKAFILLIPLFASMAEGILVASIPGLSSNSCNQAMAGMSCCKAHHAKGVNILEAKIKRTKAVDDETKENGCTALPCLNCPLCCSVTFKPVFRLDLLQSVAKIEYAVMHDHTLVGYYSQPWRPPDPSFS